MDEALSGSRVPAESRLAPENRIYVNRNLRLGSVKAIGFDLDHTLAHYRGPAVEELAYDLARRRLVERFGYSEELLSVTYDRTFVIRGLVIDKRRGNILKMDYHNYVARGYHGLRHLRAEERKADYRTGRVRMSSDAYVTVDTLFHLPEVYLYVALVDLAERTNKPKRRGRRSFTRIYEHVRESIDSVHGDGSLKREILGDLGRFVRGNPRLVTTLSDLKRVGKKLFLLTNSEYYYSDAILGYLMKSAGEPDRDWRELFDYIIVDAGKPTFFTANEKERPATRMEVEGTRTPVFSAGCARSLEDALGYRGDEIMYFGDHTYGDILRSKKSLGWRTAMVVEELEDELKTSAKLGPQIHELSHWKTQRGVLESDISALDMEIGILERRQIKLGKDYSARIETFTAKRNEMNSELKRVKRVTSDLGEKINKAYNRFWGPIFREGQETSRFGHQVKDFACLYMTSVTNLQNYPANHYFRAAIELMPHEMVGDTERPPVP